MSSLTDNELASIKSKNIDLYAQLLEAKIQALTTEVTNYKQLLLATPTSPTDQSTKDQQSNQTQQQQQQQQHEQQSQINQSFDLNTSITLGQNQIPYQAAQHNHNGAICFDEQYIYGLRNDYCRQLELLQERINALEEVEKQLNLRHHSTIIHFEQQQQQIMQQAEYECDMLLTTNSQLNQLISVLRSFLYKLSYTTSRLFTVMKQVDQLNHDILTIEQEMIQLSYRYQQSQLLQEKAKLRRNLQEQQKIQKLQKEQERLALEMKTKELQQKQYHEQQQIQSMNNTNQIEDDNVQSSPHPHSVVSEQMPETTQTTNQSNLSMTSQQSHHLAASAPHINQQQQQHMNILNKTDQILEEMKHNVENVNISLDESNSQIEHGNNDTSILQPYELNHAQSQRDDINNNINTNNNNTNKIHNDDELQEESDECVEKPLQNNNNTNIHDDTTTQNQNNNETNQQNDMNSNDDNQQEQEQELSPEEIELQIQNQQKQFLLSYQELSSQLTSLRSQQQQALTLQSQLIEDISNTIMLVIQHQQNGGSLLSMSALSQPGSNGNLTDEQQMTDSHDSSYCNYSSSYTIESSTMTGSQLTNSQMNNSQQIKDSLILSNGQNQYGSAIINNNNEIGMMTQSSQSVNNHNNQQKENNNLNNSTSNNYVVTNDNGSERLFELQQNKLNSTPTNKNNGNIPSSTNDDTIQSDMNNQSTTTTTTNNNNNQITVETSTSSTPTLTPTSSMIPESFVSRLFAGFWSGIGMLAQKQQQNRNDDDMTEIDEKGDIIIKKVSAEDITPDESRQEFLRRRRELLSLQNSQNLQLSSNNNNHHPQQQQPNSNNTSQQSQLTNNTSQQQRQQPQQQQTNQTNQTNQNNNNNNNNNNNTTFTIDETLELQNDELEPEDIEDEDNDYNDDEDYYDDDSIQNSQSNLNNSQSTFETTLASILDTVGPEALYSYIQPELANELYFKHNMEKLRKGAKNHTLTYEESNQLLELTNNVIMESLSKTFFAHNMVDEFDILELFTPDQVTTTVVSPNGDDIDHDNNNNDDMISNNDIDQQSQSQLYIDTDALSYRSTRSNESKTSTTSNIPNESLLTPRRKNQRKSHIEVIPIDPMSEIATTDVISTTNLSTNLLHETASNSHLPPAQKAIKRLQTEVKRHLQHGDNNTNNNGTNNDCLNHSQPNLQSSSPSLQTQHQHHGHTNQSNNHHHQSTSQTHSQKPSVVLDQDLIRQHLKESRQLSMTWALRQPGFQLFGSQSNNIFSSNFLFNSGELDEQQQQHAGHNNNGTHNHNNKSKKKKNHHHSKSSKKYTHFDEFDFEDDIDWDNFDLEMYLNFPEIDFNQFDPAAYQIVEEQLKSIGLSPLEHDSFFSTTKQKNHNDTNNIRDGQQYNRGSNSNTNTNSTTTTTTHQPIVTTPPTTTMTTPTTPPTIPATPTKQPPPQSPSKKQPPSQQPLPPTTTTTTSIQQQQPSTTTTTTTLTPNSSQPSQQTKQYHPHSVYTDDTNVWTQPQQSARVQQLQQLQQKHLKDDDDIPLALLQHELQFQQQNSFVPPDLNSKEYKRMKKTTPRAHLQHDIITMQPTYTPEQQMKLQQQRQKKQQQQQERLQQQQLQKQLEKHQQQLLQQQEQQLSLPNDGKQHPARLTLPQAVTIQPPTAPKQMPLPSHYIPPSSNTIISPTGPTSTSTSSSSSLTSTQQLSQSQFNLPAGYTPAGILSEVNQASMEFKLQLKMLEEKDRQQKHLTERQFITQLGTNVVMQFLDSQQEYQLEFQKQIDLLKQSLPLDEQKKLEDDTNLQSIFEEKFRHDLDLKLSQQLRDTMFKVLHNDNFDDKVKEQAVFILQRKLALKHDPEGRIHPYAVSNPLDYTSTYADEKALKEMRRIAHQRELRLRLAAAVEVKKKHDQGKGLMSTMFDYGKKKLWG